MLFFLQSTIQCTPFRLLFRNFPSPPQNSLYKIVAERTITIDDPHTSVRDVRSRITRNDWARWDKCTSFTGRIQESERETKELCYMYFQMDVTILTRPRSDAVERTSDIALQLKPVLFTERPRFDLRRSVDMSRHEDLHSFTSMYGGNGDSW